ncbi:hypothetical protein IWQ61_007178 [Dispira simplex]|nr:hypothetical protein IWQ61_007178 [Dispira simplex]
MEGIKVFDVTFPTHPGVPKCKPGSTLYGVVATQCLQPLRVESLGLRFRDKEQVATCLDTKLSNYEPTPVHLDPLIWPESLLPQALNDPTLIYKDAYQGNKLAYHIKTQLDQLTYFLGDTVSVKFDIKPVVNYAPPSMVELSIQEQCKCHTKYLLEHQSSEEPVWAWGHMLHWEVLQFTKGNGVWYWAKAHLTVPSTVCPVDGVHMV